ncbi:AMIN-like domain-containing (lipo)protein [Micromonospora sp. DT47]|uniref:AMIN-like domain-containing (lipo)protein n=1 Tax=Micromonospora sp. DT47 TaxID=3393431 RepID=UPI003CFAF357
MTRQRVPLLASLVVLLAAACTTDHDGATPAPPTTTASSASVAATGPATTPPATAGPSVTRPAAPGDWHVTYGWAVPTAPARVSHTVRLPLTPPPGEPLPVLVEVRVGDHPDEDFSRITFAFRGPIPGYEVAYVARVEQDGSGDPVDLPGTAFLALRFNPAQAHDGAGRNTASTPPRTIGFPTLRGWAPAGDFEGYLSFGLGLSRGGLPVRLGESTRPDGTHVVSVDVRRS